MSGSGWEKFAFAFYGIVVGVCLGVGLSRQELALAKGYNLQADTTLVEAIQLQDEARDLLDRVDKLATDTLDVCLGRVSL